MKGKTPDTKAHSRPDSVPEIPRLERLEAGSHCQRLGVRTIGRAMSGEFRLPLGVRALQMAPKVVEVSLN